MELHERLVVARTAAGYETAADAARALNKPYPTYAGHENGSSGFRAGTAAVYARRFGVSFEWLLRGTGDMKGKTEDPDRAETIRLLDEASPEVRTAVKILLKQRMPAVSVELGSASKGRKRPSPK